MQDTIERIITSSKPISEAWTAFSSPSGICSWFCEQVEGVWAPGEEVFLIWGEHRVKARILAIKEPVTFSYEWVPGVAGAELTPGSLTQVEFTLTSTSSGGTEVRMIESGFASLPAEAYENAMKENSEGWTSELKKLEKLLGAE